MEKGIIITVLVLVLGIGLFIANDGIGRQQRMNGDIYNDIRIKTNYLGNDVKLFALVDEDALAAYPGQGARAPTDAAMILGSAEARMMMDEGLIAGTGSELKGFFGIDTIVGGILLSTSGPLDDLHFLSEAQFEAIRGEEGRTYVLLTEERMPKLFYKRGISEETPLVMELAEGKMDDYRMQTINDKQYTPLIIGSSEAAMMREERLFANVGDRIDGFFGNDVVIVGVMGATGTAADMMHFLP